MALIGFSHLTLVSMVRVGHLIQVKQRRYYGVFGGASMVSHHENPESFSHLNHSGPKDF
jgi:hypothetical protein